MTVNVPLTVSVVGVDNSPFEGIMVELYKDGILQTNDDLTNENGAVVFTLNDGTYQFAANLSNTRFWSEPCTMPGCTDQTIVLPGGQSSIAETMISYEYDDLYRLTEANYDNGLYYHYAYDAGGNRLTETTQNNSTSYTYDIANRLTSVNGVTYTWDNNGNLLSDGTSTYSYDYNNKLVGLTQGTDVYQYAYNGLGDRIRQIVNGVTTDYVLDINTGLTQVLQDGTNTYQYGVNRVSQATATETEYFLPDALGSVRNLTGANAAITLTQSYTPFGEVLASSGAGQTGYAFTGEMFDPTTGLVFLRARYYTAGDGRFVSRDVWEGDSQTPMSYIGWLYGYENPLRYIDPLGKFPIDSLIECPIDGWDCEAVGNVMLLKEAFIDSASRHNALSTMDNNGFAALLASTIVSERRIGNRPDMDNERNKTSQLLEFLAAIQGCTVSGYSIKEALKAEDYVLLINYILNKEVPMRATVGIGNVWLDTAENILKGKACSSLGDCASISVNKLQYKNDFGQLINISNPFDLNKIVCYPNDCYSVQQDELQPFVKLTRQLLNRKINIEYVAANLEAGAQRARVLGIFPTAFNSASWHMRGLQTDEEFINGRWNPGGAVWIIEHISTVLKIMGISSSWSLNMEPEYEKYK